MAHLTRDEILKSGEVNLEYQKVFASRPIDTTPRSAEWSDLRAARSEPLAQLRQHYIIPGPIPSQVKETMHSIPTRDGATIRVKVYQPVPSAVEIPKAGSPVVVMFHEGGWCVGDLSDEDLNCRLFARELGCVCVNVEYRLAPEHPFPTGLNDCWDALEWTISASASLAASPTQGLIVGGSSAGGNIAAALALLSRDRNLQPPITGQYLSVPALITGKNVPAHLKTRFTSIYSSSNDPILKPESMDYVLPIWQPDLESPLAVPHCHPDGHKGVAKAFFQVCGLDPLRDDAVLYDIKLREAGVLTRFELYAGLGHMFWSNWPEMKEAKAFVEDTVKGVRWLLEK
ncbi:hypothetical protein BU24DRAFT_419450 [Aaosphaeria arxii CBS 175.79]|uniref:Alpha/beta hydrolase fold-3 domain-containing protein n=1 Tax=Aaosphaeria arxii CBS 175.79 TaxID=1450172 RepID=A0A6A5Y484_9PLEO|nr:uncharacterized protein BU24DRAFT_419450 [Aaosphaeria arxii CBS 175.79]KAF2019837.1 hypothetical protein BU24DRAFT_419450 [Aaosphaeria arxii CBS 175.79]